jgi:BRCT domain type II-containing protein
VSGKTDFLIMGANCGRSKYDQVRVVDGYVVVEEESEQEGRHVCAALLC